MSQENAEIVRELFAAFSAHDMEAFLAHIDPDVEFEPLLGEAEGRQTYRGYEGVRAYYETVFRTFPDMSAQVEHLEPRNSVVLARVRVRGRGADSGVQVEQVVWAAGTFRDGKATWWAFFSSRHEALEAAGLSE